MTVKTLFPIILLITAIAGWYYFVTYPQAGARPVFTPLPLRVFTDQTAGTLTREGVVAETNRHREEHHLIALPENQLLNEAAEKKIDDILAQQYFDHVSPQGLGPADVVETTGYMYLSVGENLALGNFKDDEEIVQAWMDSPGHRENILSGGFTEMGAAVRQGEFEGRTTWVGVQMFALPQSACPTPDPRVRDRFDHQQKSVSDRQNTIEPLRLEVEALSRELEALIAEIKKLSDEGNAKIEEGNEDIRRGNEIYRETGSREQAQPYWDSGEAKQKEGRALLDQAKQKQNEANSKRNALQTRQDNYNRQVQSLNKEIAAVKQTTEQLNAGIRAYNRCLAEYK